MAALKTLTSLGSSAPLRRLAGVRGASSNLTASARPTTPWTMATKAARPMSTVTTRGNATASSSGASYSPRQELPRRGLMTVKSNTSSNVINGSARRWYSQDSPTSKIWQFEDLSTLISSPTTKPENLIIVDTREPGELVSTGRIPGSVNVPVTSAPDGFLLNPEDFEDRFGFPKPDPEADELVFYCKAGVRSRAAAGIAREAGYRNVGEYPGSWVDWSAKGGKVER